MSGIEDKKERNRRSEVVGGQSWDHVNNPRGSARFEINFDQSKAMKGFAIGSLASLLALMVAETAFSLAIHMPPSYLVSRNAVEIAALSFLTGIIVGAYQGSKES